MRYYHVPAVSHAHLSRLCGHPNQSIPCLVRINSSSNALGGQGVTRVTWLSSFLLERSFPCDSANHRFLGEIWVSDPQLDQILLICAWQHPRQHGDADRPGAWPSMGHQTTAWNSPTNAGSRSLNEMDLGITRGILDRSKATPNTLGRSLFLFKHDCIQTVSQKHLSLLLWGSSSFSEPTDLVDANLLSRQRTLKHVMKKNYSKPCSGLEGLELSGDRMAWSKCETERENHCWQIKKIQPEAASAWSSKTKP